MSSIDQLKAEIGHGHGIAKGNLFRLKLPNINGLSLGKTGDILCKSVSMPGRQMLTLDRTIGTVVNHIVYGFANDEVSLSFVGLNDYRVRKYFEDWQHLAMNKDTHVLRYKEEYAKDVIIEQLDQEENVVYAVELLHAYPVQVLPLDFSNDQNILIDINVTMSYTKWKRYEHHE